MAINVPTNISTGAEATHTLLDLRENKVQGIGFFDTLVEAQDLNTNQRCLGYLAIVSDGAAAGTVYQFTATDLIQWTSVDAWTQLGASAPTTSSVSARVLHHNLSTTVDLAQKAYAMSVSGDELQVRDVASLAVANIPNELELRFDAAETFGYKVDGGLDPFYLEPEFTRDLRDTATAQFQPGDNNDFPISSCVITGTVTVGNASMTVSNLDQNTGKFSGLSESDSTALLSGTWNAVDNAELHELLGILNSTNTHNSVNNIAANLAYTPIVPIQTNDGTYRFLHFEASTYASGPISLSSVGDSSNYTMIFNGTGDPHIGLYAWLHDDSTSLNEEVYIGGQAPSLNTLSRGANVGATGSLPTSSKITTLSDLQNKLRIKLKISDEALTAMLDEVSSTVHPATWRDLKLKVDIGITITQ